MVHDVSVPPPTISNGNISPSLNHFVWRSQFWRTTGRQPTDVRGESLPDAKSYDWISYAGLALRVLRI